MSQSSKVKRTFGSLSVGGSSISAKESQQELSVASTLTIDGSEKTFYLNSATEFATTLPPVATSQGFHARFIVKAAPVGASYTIASTAANISGSILSPADSATSSASSAGTPITTITFVDSKAVVGDFIDISCDGTNFYVTGVSSVFDGITFA